MSKVKEVNNKNEDDQRERRFVSGVMRESETVNFFLRGVENDLFSRKFT